MFLRVFSRRHRVPANHTPPHSYHENNMGVKKSSKHDGALTTQLFFFLSVARQHDIGASSRNQPTCLHFSRKVAVATHYSASMTPPTALMFLANPSPSTARSRRHLYNIKRADANPQVGVSSHSMPPYRILRRRGESGTKVTSTVTRPALTTAWQTTQLVAGEYYMRKYTKRKTLRSNGIIFDSLRR